MFEIQVVYLGGDSMREGNHLRDVGVDGRIILKEMSNQLVAGGISFDSSFSGQRQELGCCAHGNESSCSIFADWLWSCCLPQQQIAACNLLFAVRFSETHCVLLCVLCCVPVCVSTVLPYSTYSTYRAPHSHIP